MISFLVDEKEKGLKGSIERWHYERKLDTRNGVRRSTSNDIQAIETLETEFDIDHLNQSVATLSKADLLA